MKTKFIFFLPLLLLLLSIEIHANMVLKLGSATQVRHFFTNQSKKDILCNITGCYTKIIREQMHDRYTMETAIIKL